MTAQRLIAASVLASVAACSPQRDGQTPTNNVDEPVLPAPSAPPAVTNSPAPARPRSKPTVDPKSSEAAVEVVRGFADLLNQRKFEEAYMLLGPGAAPPREFHKDWERFDKLTVGVGAAGDQEGAAGSIYVSVPLNVAAVAGGKNIQRSATAILRRVNDVPGSTEAQRHWHIERIDWKDAD